MIISCLSGTYAARTADGQRRQQRAVLLSKVDAFEIHRQPLLSVELLFNFPGWPGLKNSVGRPYAVVTERHKTLNSLDLF